MFQGAATAPCLIICDHASNHVPADLAGLGLAASDLERHIAWDIGAAALARRLAQGLGATAVLSRISRLVIDCNRRLGTPTSICALSDGVAVPGNRDLSDAEAGRRAGLYFDPYHGEIARQLDRLSHHGAIAGLLAIHSFTPIMDNNPRPWHAGVLWNHDDRLAKPLIEALRREGDLEVGDNEPYSGRLANYTLDRHGEARKIAHVSLEIRQDLLADEASILAWGDRLVRIFAGLCGVAPASA